jgi:hypothetical protein
MKKVLGVFSCLMVLGMSQLFAQTQPSCNNDNGLNSKIAAIVNQGYTEINREYFEINYLVAPTAPYLLGTLQVTFVGPYCGPACTPALRIENYDARVNNDNGACVWELSGN